ncbi:methylmalonyl-CoA mutase subunit beta [Polaribacter aquimarinus]|uniref:Methylmalonyl-CoA mutase n=1 Tax=Polaribacter aquimarinus TaxID=2100726 RepID=A0A2U2JAI7_9FLAO|nr:methylmalonyl-CoA mutase subunit beta [Polaribacter aquimarinus]PWG05356.1 methylmalonyl-CoA mutase [Polaribacter aquimarinus]
MSKSLFDEFTKTSSAAWKQKIQVDLKGADYNDTLLWKTNEGIIVKPFYTIEDRTHHQIKTSEKGFNICQSIFVDDEKIANSLALNALNKGANSILFNANKTFNYVTLLKNIDCRSTILYFNFSFLNDDFQIEVSKYFNSENIYFQTDIIGNLAETGNWFKNLKSDHKKLENIVKQTNNCISVSLDLYQNSGANITQQLAYTLAHANEYLNYFGGDVSKKIYFIFSVAGNYFFEIAKIRAFRSLWSSLLEEYKIKNQQAHIFTKPSLRNKTLYDYNVNMLRTTTECMSAILGSSNTISNVSYDAIYHKSNEFGERIARNQLLILQQETGFNNPQKYAEGSYYIESITQQLTEKSLDIFKSIEKGGGFLKQLKSGIIQKKIKENDAKEKEDLIHKEMILLGTNFHLNKDDEMHQNLELYPFLKQRNIKTLITPIMRNRISEFIERERLKAENV